MGDMVLRALVYGCVAVLIVWTLLVVGFVGRGLVLAISSWLGKRG